MGTIAGPDKVQKDHEILGNVESISFFSPDTRIVNLHFPVLGDLHGYGSKCRDHKDMSSLKGL